jgi:hypothetical protein
MAMAGRYQNGFASGFDREVLHELEGEYEGELGIAHEGEGPLHEYEFEYEGEFEGEQFFGRLRNIARGVGRFVRRAAPILGRIAKIAAPIVASAVGGPLGGIIARGATTLLGEGELEEELAHELGLHEGHLEGVHEAHPESVLHELEGVHEMGLHEMGLHEGHLEGVHEGHPEAILHELGLHEGAMHEAHPESVLHELEGVHEMGLHEGHLEGVHEGHPEAILHELGLHEGALHEGSVHEAHPELVAELMAEVAAGAQHEAEAEAMAGAATVITLSPADRAALQRLIPHLVRGAAILTRILRRRRITRPAVRTVPLIVRQTARALRRRAATGAPLTRRAAGQIMGAVTRRVLSNPRVCALSIARNVRSSMRSRQGSRSIAG